MAFIKVIDLYFNRQSCGSWRIDETDTPAHLAACLEAMAAGLKEAAAALRIDRVGTVTVGSHHEPDDESSLAEITMSRGTEARVPVYKKVYADRENKVRMSR